MTRESSDSELLRLVEQRCTVEDIQGLLRRAKQRSPASGRIRIGASDKESLLNTNLQDALNGGLVGRDEVFELLRNAEENGNQHVFFFRRKSASGNTSARTIQAIGSKLLGDGWASKVPNVEAVEGKYVIADLRDASKADWILKLYGTETVTRYGKIRVIEGQEYIPVNRDSVRVVLIARWRQPDLLEFRVPRVDSRRRIEAWVKVLWNKIEPAVKATDFEPWDLQVVRRHLAQREEENSAVYSTRDIRIFDPRHDSRASFEGHTETYDLFSKPEYWDVVQKLMKAGDRCTHLGVKWHQIKNQATPSRELQIILMGERAPNELVIIAHCQPADVDYVTKKLRAFSR